MLPSQIFGHHVLCGFHPKEVGGNIHGVICEDCAGPFSFNLEHLCAFAGPLLFSSKEIIFYLARERLYTQSLKTYWHLSRDALFTVSIRSNKNTDTNMNKEIKEEEEEKESGCIQAEYSFSNGYRHYHSLLLLLNRRLFLASGFM